MSSEITDLPPPWPHHALAMARRAHSIPMTEPNLRAEAVVATEGVQNDAKVDSGNRSSAAPVDIEA